MSAGSRDVAEVGHANRCELFCLATTALNSRFHLVPGPSGSSGTFSGAMWLGICGPVTASATSIADAEKENVLVRRDRRCRYPPRAASCAAVRSAFAIASIWATVMFA